MRPPKVQRLFVTLHSPCISSGLPYNASMELGQHSTLLYLPTVSDLIVVFLNIRFHHHIFLSFLNLPIRTLVFNSTTHILSRILRLRFLNIGLHLANMFSSAHIPRRGDFDSLSLFLHPHALVF